MKKSYSFNGLLENNTFLMVLSLIAAVLLWFGIVSQDKEAREIIRNVPVSIDVVDSALARLGLEPIGNQSYSVDVEITGTRAAVGSVKASDLKIVARLTNVNAPGTFDIALEGYDLHNKGIVVKGTDPSKVSMRFDHVTEKVLPVKLELSGLNIPEGYILSQEYIYPQEIIVKGPATEMESLETALATIVFDKSVSQTVSYDVPVTLLDKSGDSMLLTNFQMSSSYAMVTLPVLKKKVVPVTVDFINVPSGFDLESLNYLIDPETIELAGPVSSINNITELHLGYIDFRTLEPNASLYYTTPLPAGYIAVENIQSIGVEFFDEGYDERLMNVSDIRLINAPANYTISIQTKTIYGVTVFGPRDEVARLMPRNLIAEIDMSQVDLRAGTATVPVSIIIPGAPKCWAYGNGYTAVITAREK